MTYTILTILTKVTTSSTTTAPTTARPNTTELGMPPMDISLITWLIFYYPLPSDIGHKTYIYLSLTGKCQGPTKCGRNHFCVGFEGKKVFCYGSDTRCLWYSNTCSNDADCNKYTINSPKFTNGDNVDCSKLTGWRIDACTCIGKLDLQRVKALDNPFLSYLFYLCV